LDYQIEFLPAVIGNDADSIATLDVSLAPNSPGDLAVVSSGADGTRAILWISGGQGGTVYVVTVLVTTTNGRTLQRSILLPVLSLSSPPIPILAIQTSTGLVLTDQNGSPFLST
jgi:hypothetical protein